MILHLIYKYKNGKRHNVSAYLNFAVSDSFNSQVCHRQRNNDCKAALGEHKSSKNFKNKEQ